MLLFYNSNLNKEFCDKIINLLNNDESFKKTEVAYTPRVVGDLVQLSIENNIESFGYHKTDTKITKRSMADIEINDDEHNLVRIDVKTHYINSDFSMPNLVSSTRLYKFYKIPTNYFAILMVDYDIVNGFPIFTKVWLLPIENIDWGCLGIGSLGNGQIQIKNAHIINFNFNITRNEWINEFKDIMINNFIDKQIKKLVKLRDYFTND